MPVADNGAERACVVWLTGLPSSGKSTLAALLVDALQKDGRRVERLDGDEVRTWLTPDLGFTREARDENVRRVAGVARLLVRHGVMVVASLVSPYRKAREDARAIVGDFVEVHVDCDTAECARRDVKGLYRRALAGEITGFTGVSDPYEPPESPEVTVRTDREGREECAAKILAALAARGYIAREA
jgi:adenylyl-sulfate kinase